MMNTEYYTEKEISFHSICGVMKKHVLRLQSTIIFGANTGELIVPRRVLTFIEMEMIFRFFHLCCL
jgi:hypothetical protein